MGIMRPERIALFPLNVVLLPGAPLRSEEHTSELQSRLHLVCRLLLEKKKTTEHRKWAESRPVPPAPGRPSCDAAGTAPDNPTVAILHCPACHTSLHAVRISAERSRMH